jgi:hypothetical protein
MANTATAQSANQEASTWVSAQPSIMWSTKTTKAATPAANNQRARFWVDVVDPALMDDTEGTGPKTDFSVVEFIFNSLRSVLLAFAIQIIKTTNPY